MESLVERVWPVGLNHLVWHHESVLLWSLLNHGHELWPLHWYAIGQCVLRLLSDGLLDLLERLLVKLDCDDERCQDDDAEYEEKHQVLMVVLVALAVEAILRTEAFLLLLFILHSLDNRLGFECLCVES